jgi:hypothetical protein
LFIIKLFAEEIATYKDTRIINVFIDKRNKPGDYDILEKAWSALLQRFMTTIKHKNFPCNSNDYDGAIIFHDFTNNEKVKKLIRKLRRYNPVPNKKILGFSSGYRNLKMDLLIEDPNPRVSLHSYFIQMADLSAYLLYQFHLPNSYMKRKGGKNYFMKLDPVLCKSASASNPYGIVYL